jgi:hypothetical protein
LASVSWTALSRSAGSILPLQAGHHLQQHTGRSWNLTRHHT